MLIRMIVGFAIPSGAARDEGGSVVAWYHLVRALRRAAAVLHEQLVLPHPPNHQRPCKVTSRLAELVVRRISNTRRNQTVSQIREANRPVCREQGLQGAHRQEP